MPTLSRCGLHRPRYSSRRGSSIRLRRWTANPRSTLPWQSEFPAQHRFDGKAAREAGQPRRSSNQRSSIKSFYRFSAMIRASDRNTHQWNRSSPAPPSRTSRNSSTSAASPKRPRSTQSFAKTSRPFWSEFMPTRIAATSPATSSASYASISAVGSSIGDSSDFGVLTAATIWRSLLAAKTAPYAPRAGADGWLKLPPI